MAEAILAQRLISVISLTGDEVVRCLERLKISRRYYVCPRDLLAPGESVTFSIAPPRDRVCIVATALPLSSLHYDVSWKASYTDAFGVEADRISVTNFAPEDSFQPLDYLFCEPRILYDHLFTNNHPTSQAWVGVKHVCNVTRKDHYNVIAETLLGAVFEALRLKAEQLRVAWVRVPIRIPLGSAPDPLEELSRSAPTKLRCPKCGQVILVDFEARKKRWLIRSDEFVKRWHSDCKLIGTLKQVEQALEAGKLVEVS